MRDWSDQSDREEIPGRQARRDLQRERDLPRPVCKTLQVDIARAVRMVGGATCIMTSAYELRRGGIMVNRVMQCADEPPCVAVAVPKGQRFATLIRDSHAFALTVIDPAQRLLMKKFDPGQEHGDPFDLIQTRRLVTGAPVVLRGTVGLDCEVMRHFDLEADHEVYVGQVIAALVFSKEIESAQVMQHDLADPGVGDDGGTLQIERHNGHSHPDPQTERVAG